MKLKGISFFEQHVEKGVLALFILVAAGLFVMQFLSPSTVDVQGAGAVPPERLEEEITTRAQTVLSRLEGSFSAENAPPEVASARSAADDRAAWDNLVATTGNLYDESRTVREVITGTGDGDGTDALTLEYAVVEPPAPSKPTVIAEAGTVDPFVPARFPGASALLPAEQPYDTRYVSIQAAFDATSFFEALGIAPDDENILVLPPSWWQGVVELVDVRVERERRLDSTGWGELTMLDALPGREGLRALLSNEDLVPARLVEVLDGEAQLRANIRRPAMYPMIAGPQWVRPVAYRELHGMNVVTTDDAAQTVDPERASLERRIRNTHGEIRRNEQTIQRLQQQLGTIGGGNGGGRTAPGSGRGGGSSVWLEPTPQLPGWPEIPSDWLAQRSGPGEDDNDDRDADQRRRERLQRQIAGLEATNVRLQERLDELCARLADEFDGDCDELLGLNQGQEPVSDTPVIEPLDEPLESLQDMPGAVTLWAHDLTAKAGKTYRYRVTVSLINPFFAHQDALGDAQKSLADSPTIETDPGAWSDPVQVFPETYIRVLQASTASRPVGAGALGSRTRPARAGVEVFRFYYGYWRSAEIDLLPGDQVVAAIELPELPMFEVTPGEEGGDPVLVGTSELDDELAFASDLFMSGVFEFRSGGSTVTDVLFSTMPGRTHIASQARDALADLIDRSIAAAEGAQVLQPGSGPQANPNQPGNRPGTAPPRGTPPGRDQPPGRGNPRGVPTGPALIPD